MQIERRMIGSLMSDELESIWKGTVVAYLNYYFSDGNEENHKKYRFFPEGGVGLVPKRGCLLTLALLRILQMMLVWRATVE
jgi:hypothetical protein